MASLDVGRQFQVVSLAGSHAEVVNPNTNRDGCHEPCYIYECLGMSRIRDKRSLLGSELRVRSFVMDRIWGHVCLTTSWVKD